MASPEVRKALRERFPVEEIRQRQGPGGKMLDYVAGESVIRRLLSATAEEAQGYAWQAVIHTLEKLESGSYLAVVQGYLLVGGDQGAGVGAMINNDPDMALKSANTEALKNAAKNGFGVGLELWDAEYREGLKARRRLIAGDAAAMKQAVFKLAKDRLGVSKPSAKDVAELFGTTASKLQDTEVLRSILTDEGLL